MCAGGEGRAGRGRASGSVNSGPGVGFIFLNPTAPPRPRAASAPPPLEPREHARAHALLPVRVPRSDHLLLAVPARPPAPRIQLTSTSPGPIPPSPRLEATSAVGEKEVLVATRARTTTSVRS